MWRKFFDGMQVHMLKVIAGLFYFSFLVPSLVINVGQSRQTDPIGKQKEKQTINILD